MGRVIEVNESLWVGLSDVAKRARRTPENIVRGLICEYLETEADRVQDKALRRAAKVSGFKEEGAVRLVQDYRTQMRTGAATKAGDVATRYRRSRSK